MARPDDSNAPRKIAWLLVFVLLLTLTIFGVIYGCARAEQRGEMQLSIVPAAVQTTIFPGENRVISSPI